MKTTLFGCVLSALMLASCSSEQNVTETSLILGVQGLSLQKRVGLSITEVKWKRSPKCLFPLIRMEWRPSSSQTLKQIAL